MTRCAIVLLMLASAAWIGCEETEDGVVRATGTVVYVDLEGGFYGLVTDKGNKYDPLNLPEQFKKDKLKVRFAARLRPDMAGIKMWGTIVEIVKIEPR